MAIYPQGILSYASNKYQITKYQKDWLQAFLVLWANSRGKRGLSYWSLEDRKDRRTMELTKEEQVFLRLLMRDAWYECDMRNKSQSERKLFLQIQSKLSRELINA